eukprot:TRINITY_DN4893_c0_g1_i1.p1 TRINITY_DN4893_c0_g1~~TRINITY_DN4893_c0_g1_i1.p1  ORF type:complete len:826 (+),score=279.32 TRINITY_DN4893_c0_g1_i1:84-2561(+)
MCVEHSGEVSVAVGSRFCTASSVVRSGKATATVPSTVRILGVDRGLQPLLEGVPRPPAEGVNSVGVLAAVLLRLRLQLESAAGTVVRQAAVAVPRSMGPLQRRAVRDAACIAGFKATLTQATLHSTVAVRLADGSVVPVLEEGERLPASRTMQFTTECRRGVGRAACARVVHGPACSSVGTYYVRAESDAVGVRFAADADGVLSVAAADGGPDRVLYAPADGDLQLHRSEAKEVAEVVWRTVTGAGLVGAAELRAEVEAALEFGGAAAAEAHTAEPLLDRANYVELTYRAHRVRSAVRRQRCTSAAIAAVCAAAAASSAPAPKRHPPPACASAVKRPREDDDAARKNGDRPHITLFAKRRRQGAAAESEPPQQQPPPPPPPPRALTVGDVVVPTDGASAGLLGRVVSIGPDLATVVFQEHTWTKPSPVSSESAGWEPAEQVDRELPVSALRRVPEPLSWLPVGFARQRRLAAWSGRAGSFMLACDIRRRGGGNLAKGFMSAPRREVSALIRGLDPHDRCLYAVVPPGQPVDLYLDFDGAAECTSAQAFTELEMVCCRLADAMTETAGGAPEWLVVLSGCRPGKTSFHVHARMHEGAAWADSMALKAWLQRTFSREPAPACFASVDTAPYGKWKCFRLPGCSKRAPLGSRLYPLTCVQAGDTRRERLDGLLSSLSPDWLHDPAAVVQHCLISRPDAVAGAVRVIGTPGTAVGTAVAGDARGATREVRQMCASVLRSLHAAFSGAAADGVVVSMVSGADVTYRVQLPGVRWCMRLRRSHRVAQSILLLHRHHFEAVCFSDDCGGSARPAVPYPSGALPHVLRLFGDD